jgi:hypothetical protein
MPVTYDLLIPTIPHRHELLCALLAEIGRQWLPGVGVRVHRTQPAVPGVVPGLREKNQALLNSSTAEYVSWLDDDDWLAAAYLPKVMEALERKPDYVGFRVAYTVDGQPRMPVVHSLRYHAWEDRDGTLLRDITALNPVRRDLANLGRWDTAEQEHGADHHWASQVRQSGLCKTEVFLDEDMYHYRYRPGDSYLSPREPVPDWPPLPEYPWLTALEAC